MTPSNKKIVFYLFLILTITGILTYSWQGIYLPIDKESKEEIIFLIQKGEGTKEISVNLEKKGLIRMATLFRIYTMYKGVSSKLQAGEYSLSSSMSIPEITQKFVSGSVKKDKITIIEGWSVSEIAQYLEEKDFKKEEFLEEIKKDFSGNFSYLADKPKDLNLEGYIFPDTYEIRKGENSEEIIRKALLNLDNKLTKEIREDINEQERTIFEIITMASMIEKEVKTIEDKKMVSGILWKRLENDMLLQVDATISFITGKKGVDISIEEMKIDSPYNTYKYKGLPLGPICNPSIESIRAAIYPESNEYWYYLSTPEGESIFTKTLEEHNIAKEKYLK